MKRAKAVWPYDWSNPFEFEKHLRKWINDYNIDFPNQALGDLTPQEFYEKYIVKEPMVLT